MSGGAEEQRSGGAKERRSKGAISEERRAKKLGVRSGVKIPASFWTSTRQTNHPLSWRSVLFASLLTANCFFANRFLASQRRAAAW
jgi:hypothetical protein